MRMPARLGWAAAAALLLFSVPGSAAEPGPMVLGVQTHFSQNWPAALVDRVKEFGAPAIRDSVPWPVGEKQAGRYDFTGAQTIALRDACRRSVDLLLTIDPRNPLYDGGHAATTPAAQQAYANYIVALIDALPGCIAAIEVGNEINGGKGLDFVGGVDPITAYASLMRKVAATVRPRHPKVALLGGSTNLIGTGFLARLFGAGLLSNADGIVVHPYRSHAEGVDFELAHLRAVMRRYGTEKPIWATEFGDYYPTAEAAPPEQVKMATLMSAAGVARAYWYALVDQPWFPNMGLLDANQRPKPAADSFRAIQARLLPAGRARRIDAGDPRTFLFRFGNGDLVLWGAVRPITFTGPATVRDARGRTIAAPVNIGMSPLIVSGATGYTFGKSPILADSLLEFGAAPWSYLARVGSAAAAPMRLQDRTFESVFSLDARVPLRLTNLGGSPGGDAARPERAMLRWTSKSAQQVKVAACLSKPALGDGVDLTIRQGARVIYTGVLVDRLMVTDVLATVPAGGALDFEFGPNRTAGQDTFVAHVQLVAPDAAIVPTCL